MQSKLALAERALGRLDGVSLLLPDPNRFVKMYVRQEAVLSSQIEGTQASLCDLLDYEAAENEAEKTVDLSEVINYLAALKTGFELLPELPISTRLFCRVHAALTKGARGGEPNKTPGELRRTQNWIGGSRPDNATFVPPPVLEMKTAMSDLEKYLNKTKQTPLLIEIGFAHAQFETIHPFLDGNGRIGRLLITFLLSARGVLSKPLLYLSHHFKLRRDEYYERLQAVRTNGDWEGWLTYFLEGVAAVADEATQRARKIILLREADETTIRAKLGRRSAVGLDLLDLLVERPVVSSRIARDHLQRSQPTVDKLLSDFVALGILREMTGQRWGRRFSYTRYLALFETS
jgi:Fic family protein